ncbi:DUF4440 domain-containing protein [Pseudalkalibacillus hwajinpoensis]|uniref:DUF4440 domain-containing protein n=1 Tax=Guptibacillus hwajinpoensis TaxID=208199 RepID=A0A4U1MJB7_9BACL|nr:DUF4440 domain-containing protein [Pseudalkalibacillus hwajinpoensis]TKD71499.1 DUF4440 domain-containing protein [Pseudalkalibacillus hwajinpoensis]
MVETNLKELIKKLEESHINLEIRSSAEELDKILADEFFEIGASGNKIYKKDCIDSGLALDELSLYDFEVHPLGPFAVLTTYFINNKTNNRNTLRSSIWKYIDERWQLYFHQGTVTNLRVEDVNK